MDIVVTQENLHRALSAASRATTSRGGLPILANILLRVINNQLLVAATNLELASTTYIGAKVDAVGEITIPSKIIAEYIANLPKEPVHLVVKKNNLTITCGGYTSTINGTPTDDFPELPEISTDKSVNYELDSHEFKQAVSQTIFATGSDASRPVLTGVYWHSYEGELFLVATDGYRLAERKLIATTSELSAIIPSSTLQEVQRLLSDDIDTVGVFFDNTQVRFLVGITEVTSRLIEGKFPDYRQLIPQKNDTTTTVDKADLVRTTKIASLFARDAGGSITMTTNQDTQELQINTTASDIGENTTVIKAETNSDGAITLNSRYLSEALAVIDEPRVEISFSGKLSPITIHPSTENQNYTHIIMPLKS